MALATRGRLAGRRVAEPGPAPPLPMRRNRVLLAAIVAVGGGLGVLVVHDGTPAWQLVRLLVVGALTAAGASTVPGARRVPQAAASFAIGAVATAIGIGIGLPHLAKAGPLLETASGLLVLVAGLVLLAVGGAALVRTARSWRRPPVAMGLLATLFVVVWSVGQGVAATNVPRGSVGSATPADRGLDFLDVELETPDGVRLSGWYVPSENGAAVALLHGAGSTRSGVLDHAEVLASAGYGVLLYDARGHGRSDGRAMDFGWYGDDDAAAAVDFLVAQPDVSGGRIALLGMSKGGEEAIGASAADPRVLAVVAEGATNRVAGDKAWLSDEHGWRGALQEQVERLVYGVTDLLTEAEPPIALREAAAVAAPRPLLLIAGGAMPDEIGAGRHIVAAAPGSAELWVVPGAGHTDGLDTQPEAWRARVVAFLDDALAVARR